jgi:hypothetical protein
MILFVLDYRGAAIRLRDCWGTRWFEADGVARALALPDPAAVLRELGDFDEDALWSPTHPAWCPGDTFQVTPAGAEFLIRQAPDEVGAWRFRLWLEREVMPVVERNAFPIWPAEIDLDDLDDVKAAHALLTKVVPDPSPVQIDIRDPGQLAEIDRQRFGAGSLSPVELVYDSGCWRQVRRIPPQRPPHHIDINDPRQLAEVLRQRITCLARA